MFRSCNKNLRQNRNTLFQLCPQGESVVTKDVLQKLGYNFQLFTSLYISDKKEIKYILHFWMKMGVSGFRMDAVPFMLMNKGNEKFKGDPHDFFNSMESCFVHR